MNPSDYPAQALFVHHYLYVGHSYQTSDPRAQEFLLASPAIMKPILGSNSMLTGVQTRQAAVQRVETY